MAHAGARLVRLDAQALARAGCLSSVLALAPDSWGRVVALGDAAPATLRMTSSAQLASVGMPGDDDDEDEPSTDDDGDYVAIVSVRGPLMQRGSEDLCGYVDGYDSITARLGAALADPSCIACVLAIDSPGGVTSGLEEAVGRMAAMRDASGKPVHAYVDELAASAAYWIAAGVAESITVPPTGTVGSIGAFAVHCETSVADAKDGVAYTLVQDPPGKTAGNPYQPLDDEGRARMAARVNLVASRFMAAIASARNMPLASVRALDGSMKYGADAVNAGLADRVGTLEQAISFAAKAAQERENPMGIRTALAGLVKAPAEATDEQLERSARAAMPLVDLGRAVLALTGAKSADEASATVAAWQSAALRVASLEAESEAASEAKKGKKRVKAVQALVASGRVTPAEAKKDPVGEITLENLAEPWATMDLGVLRGMADKLTAQSAVAAPIATAPSEAGALVALTPEELHYAKVFKIDPKALAAHKAEELKLSAERLRAEDGAA